MPKTFQFHLNAEHFPDRKPRYADVTYRVDRGHTVVVENVNFPFNILRELRARQSMQDICMEIQIAAENNAMSYELIPQPATKISE